MDLLNRTFPAFVSDIGSVTCSHDEHHLRFFSQRPARLLTILDCEGMKIRNCSFVNRV